ncbi:hypothetical protein B0H14DRAFT_2564006 [Mycena olivaceomarginata]|nr:hypothetical protein B0H14DRAFT_2564006 [Mycena olivaceomarginata]
MTLPGYWAGVGVVPGSVPTTESGCLRIELTVSGEQALDSDGGDWGNRRPHSGTACFTQYERGETSGGEPPARESVAHLMVLMSIARAAPAFEMMTRGSIPSTLTDEVTLEAEESDTVCKLGRLPWALASSSGAWAAAGVPPSTFRGVSTTAGSLFWTLADGARKLRSPHGVVVASHGGWRKIEVVFATGNKWEDRSERVPSLHFQWFRSRLMERRGDAWKAEANYGKGFKRIACLYLSQRHGNTSPRLGDALVNGAGKMENHPKSSCPIGEDQASRTIVMGSRFAGSNFSWT